MDDNFFVYVERLELFAFFSGYPLLYAVTLFFAGKQKSKMGINGRIVSLLPFAYALVGTLYLGLQLKNLYPDYSFESMMQTMQQSILIIWGLLSILFWIPALAKKSFLSLLHSLIFFFFLVGDLFLQLSSSSEEKDIVRNDMKIYSVSILLNLIALILVTLISLLITRVKRQKRSTLIL